jgi:hypothetical protein
MLLGWWPQDQGRGSLLLVQQMQPEQHHGGGHHRHAAPFTRPTTPAFQGIAHKAAKHIQSGMT